MDAGAKSVSAYVTHGVLSGGAVARVAASPIHKLVITDSIQATEAVRVSPKVRAAQHRQPDGRGHEPHLRRDVGVEPVRLRSRIATEFLRDPAMAPLEATS